MNYWILTSEFPPLYGGGISTYCYETVNMLFKNGHDVTVFVPNYSCTSIKRQEKQGYEIVYFNPNEFYTKSFLGHEANLSFAFSQVVKHQIEKHGAPDIIESQEYMGIAYYLLQFKKLNYTLFKDLKVVITLHAPSFLYLEYNQVNFYRMPYYWVGEMEKFCIIAADCLISPSKYLVDEIGKRMNFDTSKVHIIKNPYSPSKKDNNKTIKQNKITFFGKLTPQKGSLELLKYFDLLWVKGFLHPLYMIGGGDHFYHPEGVFMNDFIHKKYKSRIKSKLLRLLGSIPPDKLNDHLEDTHLVVIPSLVDNLPYTVLEAMGMGKIVLASIQGGQSEVINDAEDGFLFDHTQPDSFEKQIKHILNLSLENIEEIASKAKKKIELNYSFEKIYSEKIKIIESVCSLKNIDFPFLNSVNKQINQEINNLKKENLLSVVVPYYNMGAYVNETIDSILNSEYKNIEIIIVNDGSTDKSSIDVLEMLKLKNSIQVIHQNNQGLAIARNKGAMQASGEFLAFLDPDDSVEPTYYKKAIDILNDINNVYFVGCWAKYFDGANGHWPAFTPEPPYLLFHNMINSSALVYKKDAFLKSGLNDSQMIFGMEDYESVISMLSKGYQGIVIPEPLWNYRIRKNSMARMFTVDKQIFLYRLISEKHSEYFAKFASQLTNLLNANGPGIHIDNPTVIYNLPGANLFSTKVKQKIIGLIKTNNLLRKTALYIKRNLKV